MKKLILFVLPLILFSCKSGIESKRVEIETATTNWNKITSILTDFSNVLTEDLKGYTENAKTYYLDENAEKALKGDIALRWDESKRFFKVATSDAYAPIQAEMNDYIQLWIETTPKIAALEDGLNTGKFVGDADAELSEINDLVAQAKLKITSWEEKRNELRVQAEKATDAMKQVYEAATKK